MTRPLLYVAGPYTHPDPVANTHRALRCASAISRESGWVPIVPHLSLLWHMVDPQPIDYWYAYDFEVLEHCDALVRLPGPSSGADVELLAARDGEIEVIEFEELPRSAQLAWLG